MSPSSGRRRNYPDEEVYEGPTDDPDDRRPHPQASSSGSGGGPSVSGVMPGEGTSNVTNATDAAESADGDENVVAGENGDDGSSAASAAGGAETEDRPEGNAEPAAVAEPEAQPSPVATPEQSPSESPEEVTNDEIGGEVENSVPPGLEPVVEGGASFAPVRVTRRPEVAQPYLVDNAKIGKKTKTFLNQERKLARALAMDQFWLDSRISRGNSMVCFTGRNYLGKLKAKTRKELKRKDIDPKDWPLFEQAIAKEWDQWQKMEACRVVSPEEAQSVDPTKIIGARVILTDKNESLRTEANPLPIEAKARMVVRGDEEAQKDEFRKDASTGSNLGAALVSQITASKGWTLRSLDAKNAYFQRERMHREVYIRPPRELPVEPGSLLEAGVSIYGFTDAARRWWKKISGVFLKLGAKPVHGEPGLFHLRDECGVLRGIFLLHVDDVLFSTDESDFAKEFMRKLIAEIQFGTEKNAREDGGVVYCGRRYEQDDDNTVRQSMGAYCENLEMAGLAKERKANGTAPLTKKEHQGLRSVLGQAQWLSRMGLPEIAFRCSRLASNLAEPCIDGLKEGNSTLRAAKKMSDRFVVYSSAVDLDNCALIAAQDASFANLKKEGGQGGRYLYMANREIMNESSSLVPCSVLEWKSNRLKRVVRSTLWVNPRDPASTPYHTSLQGYHYQCHVACVLCIDSRGEYRKASQANACVQLYPALTVSCTPHMSPVRS